MTFVRGPVSVRKRDQGSSGKLCQMIISDVLSEGWWLHGHDSEIFRTPLSAPGMVLDNNEADVSPGPLLSARVSVFAFFRGGGRRRHSV